MHVRLPDVYMQHLGGCDWATGLIEEKNQTLSATDHAKFQVTPATDRSMEPSWNRLGTILRVTGNPDCVPAQALDLIMTAFGLNVDRGTRPKILEIEKFGRNSHSGTPTIADALS